MTLSLGLKIESMFVAMAAAVTVGVGVLTVHLKANYV